MGQRERERGLSGHKDSDIIDIHWIWRPFAPDAQTENAQSVLRLYSNAASLADA